MPIRIWGESDDLLEIGGDVIDEIGCCGKESAVVIQASNQPRAPGVRVIGHYAAGDAASVWRLSVEPIDEDIPIPWPIRIEPQHAYSPAVVVDCPAGAVVRYGAGLHDE